MAGFLAALTKRKAYEATAAMVHDAFAKFGDGLLVLGHQCLCAMLTGDYILR
jgi:hypothetical protein